MKAMHNTEDGAFISVGGRGEGRGGEDNFKGQEKFRDKKRSPVHIDLHRGDEEWRQWSPLMLTQKRQMLKKEMTGYQIRIHLILQIKSFFIKCRRFYSLVHRSQL